VQRAIVEVRWGPLAGRKMILAPGTTLRVGRTERADLALPRDSQMSAIHFELAWDGSSCRLRDLESAKGTQLGGEEVKEGEVQNGGWIRAGSTDFMVYFEGATPPPFENDEPHPSDYPDEDAWVMARELKRREREARDGRAELALAMLNREEGPLYAVVDASRSERILILLRESVERSRSLYDGIEGETLAEVAPYLVELPRGSRLLERLVMEGWGKRWGIYLSCPRSFSELRRHFRRFLMVKDEETGKRYYFRFYDPGVLRLFLPTCTTRQREQLFGDIRAIFAEGEDEELKRLVATEGAC